MNRKRILALGKLGLLFGGPLALIVGLFSCGVYCGYDHRTGIAGFERDWLGMDVEVPASDDDGKKADDSGKKKKDSGDKKDSADEDDSAEKKDSGDKKDGGGKKDDGGKSVDRDSVDRDSVDRDRDRDHDRDHDHDRGGDRGRDRDRQVDAGDDGGGSRGVGDDGGQVAPVEPPQPGVKVDPLPEDLAARLSMPIVLRVKVLVDDQIIATRRDWIDYVQLTVEQASYIYQQELGITLELSSVGRWPVATAGMDGTQLLDDLRNQPREQADLLIGLTGTPEGEHVSGKTDTPIDDNPDNGAYAVVYAKEGSTRPHLRPVLHEIAHAFGAQDVTDRSTPAFIGKSWMSYAPVADTEDAWLDPKNRARILERKDLPFAPPPPPMPPPKGGEP